jgi:hypothetical protein
VGHAAFRLVIGLITSTVICYSASGESLEEALTELLSNHPRVAAAKQNQTANVEAEKAAYSAYYPKLAFTGNAGYAYTSSPSRRASGEGPLSTDTETSAVTLTETIWDGNKREANVAVADLNKQVADLTVNVTLQDVLLEAITAYHDVMRNIHLIEIAIVAQTLAASMNDQDQLVPLVDGVEANLGRKPREASADAGYLSEANLEALSATHFDADRNIARVGIDQLEHGEARGAVMQTVPAVAFAGMQSELARAVEIGRVQAPGLLDALAITADLHARLAGEEPLCAGRRRVDRGRSPERLQPSAPRMTARPRAILAP